MARISFHSPLVLPCLAGGLASLFLGTSVRATPWPLHHPRMTFPADSRKAESLMKRDLGELQALYQQEKRSGGMPKRMYEAALRHLVGLWKDTGDAAYRDQAVLACRASLDGWLERGSDERRSAVTPQGPRDESNLDARDACYHMALLYHLEGDIGHAEHAEVLLGAFADVIPEWKVYRTHYGDEYLAHPHEQDWPGMGRHWDVAGLWGTWIYMDTQAGMPLAYAYDLIHDAGIMQSRGSLATIEDMLRRHVRLQKHYGRKLGNMDGTQMRGILEMAYLLGEPQWVHDCEDWVNDIYRAMFYADGWWHEGTPSYHKQIHHNLRAIVRTWLEGYSDPPEFVAEDGTRFDSYTPGQVLKRRMARADHVLATCIQPNDIAQVIHDTSFPQPVWWTPRMTQAESHVYGCAGHVILGTGEGNHMTQASLHFGGTHGHEHYDMLNLILFAKGHELLSETRYRPIPGSRSTRQWQSATAGHVTVVIDERSQAGRNTPDFQSGIQTRKPHPEDAIEGVPDPPWRWQGHGNSMNDGKLRLCNMDFDHVQLVEADGERAYVPMPERYRRTIALVTIDDRDAYVIDIFRVRGGQLHDYMLHGCLDEPYTVEISVPFDESMPGVLHDYIRDLSAVRSDDTWSLTMRLANGRASLKTWMLAQPNTRIIHGVAPAMRRTGDAPFVAVRQADGESIFVAVHHAYTDAPVVQGADLVEATDVRVALRVSLPETVDSIVSTETGFRHRRQGRWTYEVGGREHTYEGVLTGTRRVEAGDDLDAFVTEASLPTDGSLDGQILMIELAGRLVQSFRIDHVERRDNRTLIVTPDEPGMRIGDGLIKQTYYPCWGIRGEARFRIVASLLTRP